MLTKDKVTQPERRPALTRDQLAADVEKGVVDTVVVAFTDMQGRLMGKRLDADYFMDTAGKGESVEGCNYLLALDMEMDPVPGYEMANWQEGYGDFAIVPDLAGWRRTRLPVLPNVSALTQAPDWACEVVSPSTGVIDRGRKMRVYAREQVGHLWIIDPILRTLEVYRLEDARWVVASTHAGTDVVRAEPFDAIELRLAGLWLES